MARSITGAPPGAFAREAPIAVNGANGSGGQAGLLLEAKLGDPAPSLQIRDLNGETVVLTDFRGRESLVLFWNPRCDFCQQMLDDLRNWDAGPATGTPDLLVILNGTVQEGRAMGLRSRVLIDPGNQVAVAFGARGTPMGGAS